MPSVWADNEEVTFTKDIPEDPANIYELLMGALSVSRAGQLLNSSWMARILSIAVLSRKAMKK